MQKALETVANVSEAGKGAGSSVKAAPKTSEPDRPNAGLKGVPQSLLERVSVIDCRNFGVTTCYPSCTVLLPIYSFLSTCNCNIPCTWTV